MGRILTHTYAAEYTYVDFANKRAGRTRQGWPKELGKPNDAKAKQFRDDFNKSLEAGGANAHLRAGMSNIGSVRIFLNQPNGMTVGYYTAPAFEVVN